MIVHGTARGKILVPSLVGTPPPSARKRPQADVPYGRIAAGRHHSTADPRRRGLIPVLGALIAAGMAGIALIFSGAAVPELTGFGSRAGLIDFISNPAHERFYGDRNDRMPASGTKGSCGHGRTV